MYAFTMIERHRSLVYRKSNVGGIVEEFGQPLYIPDLDKEENTIELSLEPTSRKICPNAVCESIAVLLTREFQIWKAF
jgi:hypothetical protein